MFSKIRGDESQHQKKPEYQKCRKDIEDISTAVRGDIEGAGGTQSLDEAFTNFNDIDD